MTYFGIAAIIAATGISISFIIWASRCDPKNRSFKPPSITLINWNKTPKE